jgi:hypothetical protein
VCRSIISKVLAHPQHAGTELINVVIFSGFLGLLGLTALPVCFLHRHYVIVHDTESNQPKSDFYYNFSNIGHGARSADSMLQELAIMFLNRRRSSDSGCHNNATWNHEAGNPDTSPPLSNEANAEEITEKAKSASSG